MHVTRRRRRSRAPRLLAAGTVALTLAGGGIAYAGTTVFGHDQVGSPSQGGLLLPSDQTIKPIGDRLLVDDGKLLSSTVSPDGHHLAALTNDRAVALTIVDLDGYRVQQQVGTAPGVAHLVSSNDVGQEGPTYSPDGTSLWMPQTKGFQRFPVNADGTVGTPTFVAIPDQQGTNPADPSGAAVVQHALPAQAVFSPDGSTVYAAVNGQNRVVSIDAASGAITHSWDVGVAPRDLALVGSTLYVSNEGGRRARPGDATLNSYGTPVPADQTTGATTTGTLSVIDTGDTAAPVGTIPVGLHPTALSAQRGALFVTNTGSDTVSVVDTARDQVTQTIDTQPWKSSKVGYEPDGVTLTDDGHLLVSLGRANALAVYRYTTPQAPVSYVGLLPTDYFPTDVTTVGGQVLVTNLRGIGERGPVSTIDKGPGTTPATSHNTHNSTGSLTRFTLPDDATTRRSTSTVFAQNGWDDTSLQRAGGRPAKPVAVPTRLGDPSTIKHVFLLVKENRSYDQVFGDMPQGNGDPSLAQFGEDATPNQHALARAFGLYDNTYDIGTNSAEGHNWLMQSDDPEYTESSAGEYQRSYDTEDDALGHQRSGFLWTGVEAAGGTVRNYGEFTQFLTKPGDPSWSDYYCDAENMEAHPDQGPALRTDTESPIPSLNRVTVHDYPKFDTDIPDTYRYEIWKRDFERHGPASLNMLWLSSDHTGGDPNPIAQVADNDLAVGRIVDEISHSKWWRSSAIFVVEDDTQNGVDHVDGARAPIQVISPWAQHRAVDSTYYTQITMIRTIEQILGMQPMNQKDTAATPMYGAFTNHAVMKKYDAQPNRVPLTYGVDPAPACGADQPTGSASRKASLEGGSVPTPSVAPGMARTAALWEQWLGHQHLTGATASPDYASPEQMDRYTWYASHGYRTPYPGDAKVLTPNQVPGRYLLTAEGE